MKKLIFALIVTLFSSQLVWADTYDSKFGFTMNLPSGWQPLSRQAMENSQMIHNAMTEAQKDSLKNSNKTVVGQVEKMVSTGEIEYFTNQSFPDAIISVSEQTAQVPVSKAALDQTCDALPRDLSNYSGKPIKVYDCKSASVGNSPALYAVFDGFKQGTRAFQFQVQKSPKTVLALTATCDVGNCAAVSTQFDEMVKSIKTH
jgi:hypothetical protein